MSKENTQKSVSSIVLKKKVGEKKYMHLLEYS